MGLLWTVSNGQMETVFMSHTSYKSDTDQTYGAWMDEEGRGSMFLTSANG